MPHIAQTGGAFPHESTLDFKPRHQAPYNPNGPAKSDWIISAQSDGLRYNGESLHCIANQEAETGHQGLMGSLERERTENCTTICAQNLSTSFQRDFQPSSIQPPFFYQYQYTVLP